jgi:hypothetical protein
MTWERAALSDRSRFQVGRILVPLLKELGQYVDLVLVHRLKTS